MLLAMNQPLNQKSGCLGKVVGFLQQVFGPQQARGPSRPWPYVKKRELMSKAEASFYRVLQHACGGRYLVFTKVNLSDLIEVEQGMDRSHRTTWRNKIDRKHIDFVLCDPQTLAIVAAVELDDASHQRGDARHRDGFKDEACTDAGLMLLRFKARRSYDVAAIARDLASLGQVSQA